MTTNSPKASLFFFYLLALSILFFPQTRFNFPFYFLDQPEKKSHQIIKLMHLIESHYLDPISQEALLYAAIKGVETALDSHSQFFDPQELAAMHIQNSGNYVGVGMEISSQDGNAIYVTKILPNSPAEKAGIHIGDRLINIDHIPVEAIGSVRKIAMHYLNGSVNSPVHLQVVREETDRVLDFWVKRAPIEMTSLTYKELSDDLLLINIHQFTSKTPKEFLDLWSTIAQSPPIQGLILDLRDNPGGLLEGVLELSHFFLKTGDVVTILRSKNGRSTFKKEQESALNFPQHIPIAILINEFSASASEIFAATLKENRQAILIGAKTKGKGTVQHFFPLGKNQAIKLSTAEFLTPSAKKINDIGITPHLEVPHSSHEDRQLIAAIQSLRNLFILNDSQLPQ